MSVYENVTHVIFDLDGLLMNSEPIYSRATNEICEKYGSKFITDLELRTTGSTGLKKAQLIIDELKLKVKAEPFWNEVVSRSWELLHESTLMPGVEKLINHLKQNKIPISISTGSTTTSYGIKTQNYQKIFKQFEFVVCCSSDPEVKNGKPHPDAFDVARKRFDPVPEAKTCLAFEDSINGVKSAISAGMQCVMVPDPRLTQDQCKEATIVLKSLEDFQPELFGLPKYD